MTQLPARMPDETEWEYAAFITYLTRTRSVEEATDVHQARIDRVVLDHPPIPIPIPTGAVRVTLTPQTTSPGEPRTGAVRVTLTPQTTTVTIPGPEGASVVINSLCHVGRRGFSWEQFLDTGSSTELRRGSGSAMR